MKKLIKQILNNSIQKKNESVFVYLIFFFYIVKNILQLIKKKNKPLVLAIDRPRFNLDAKQLKKNKDIRLIVISRKIFYFIGKIFIEEDFQLQSSYHFRNEKDIELWNKTIGMIHDDIHVNIENFKEKLVQHCEDKKRLFSYYEYFYKKYLKKINISHVLLSNVDYWEVQEFSKVCKKNGAKINVLYRESIASPKQNNYLKNYYSSDIFEKLPIDKIFVFGKRALLIFQNTHFISNENVYSVGAPRVDGYKKIKTSSKQNMVTLFDFSLPSYKLQNTAIETIKILNNLAKKYPKTNFLIKTKTQKETKKILSMKIVDISPNIKVSNKVKMKKIMKKSKIIIGTNTTAVIETLFLDTYFIFPSWNIEDNDLDNLIVNSNLDEELLIVSLDRINFEIKIESMLNSHINIGEKELEVREKIILENFEDFLFNSSTKIVNFLVA